MCSPGKRRRSNDEQELEKTERGFAVELVHGVLADRDYESWAVVSPQP
jgi:hypothetical protein